MRGAATGVAGEGRVLVDAQINHAVELQAQLRLEQKKSFESAFDPATRADLVLEHDNPFGPASC